MKNRRAKKRNKLDKIWAGPGVTSEGVGPQSGTLWESSGVSVAGNIRTLACMKDRSGRAPITLDASSLRCSSFRGFLSTQEVTSERQACSNTRGGLPAVLLLTWWRCWSCPWWTSAWRRRPPRGCWSWTGPSWRWSARTARGPLLGGQTGRLLLWRPGRLGNARVASYASFSELKPEHLSRCFSDNCPPSRS